MLEEEKEKGSLQAGERKERRSCLEKVPGITQIGGGSGSPVLTSLSSSPYPLVSLIEPPSHGVTWAQKSSGQVSDTLWLREQYHSVLPTATQGHTADVQHPSVLRAK